MKHLAAYLLLTLGGNTSPSVDDIIKVLSSVGAEPDKDKLDNLLKELDGKDINELITEGSKKLASVPSGGGAAVAPSGGGAASGGGGAAAPAEEKEEEEKEESDEDMGFGLFD